MNFNQILLYGMNLFIHHARKHTQTRTLMWIRALFFFDVLQMKLCIGYEASRVNYFKLLFFLFLL